MISTVTALRAAFWAAHPQYRRGVKPAGSTNGRKLYIEKRQNDYPTDVRVAWCDFVESTRRNGDITENLTQRTTL